MAYEYARRGACLALAARRKNSLREVGERALLLGSPDVLLVPTDVSKVEDCKRLIDETINHFGQRKSELKLLFFPKNLCFGVLFVMFLMILVDWFFEAVDHLVNDAGVTPLCMFEEPTEITKMAPVMVITLFVSLETRN